MSHPRATPRSALALLLLLAFAPPGCGGGGGISGSVAPTTMASSESGLSTAGVSALTAFEADPASGAPGLGVRRAISGSTVAAPDAEGWWTLAFSYAYDGRTYAVTVRFRFLSGGSPVVTADQATVGIALAGASRLEFSATVAGGGFTLSQTGAIANLSCAVPLELPVTASASGSFVGEGAVTFSDDDTYRLALAETGTVGLVLKPVAPRSATFWSDLAVTLTATDGWTIALDTQPDGTATGTVKNAGGTTVATLAKTAGGKTTLTPAVAGAFTAKELQITY